MRPDISEFSYGYALTEVLITTFGGLTAAPEFPSQRAEGTWGGYDVKMPFAGRAAFLQFKLSDRMERRSAREVRDGYLSAPFFRAHLRPRRHSNQHDLLLELEGTGELVAYAAPKFASPDELNSAYLNRTIVDDSIFVQPSGIGPLPDLDDHYLAFEATGPVFLCSAARKLTRGIVSKRELAGLLTSHRAKSITGLIERARDNLLRSIVEVLHEDDGFMDDYGAGWHDRSPWQQVTFLARTFFGCEAMLLGRPSK